MLSTVQVDSALCIGLYAGRTSNAQRSARQTRGESRGTGASVRSPRIALLNIARMPLRPTMHPRPAITMYRRIDCSAQSARSIYVFFFLCSMLMYAICRTASKPSSGKHQVFWLSPADDVIGDLGGKTALLLSDRDRTFSLDPVQHVHRLLGRALPSYCAHTCGEWWVRLSWGSSGKTWVTLTHYLLTCCVWESCVRPTTSSLRSEPLPTTTDMQQCLRCFRTAKCGPSTKILPRKTEMRVVKDYRS